MKIIAKNKDGKASFSISKWLLDNKFNLLGFILPIVSMLLVYKLKNIWPFADETYLRSDCYHQYTPYLEILKDKLKDGGSLLYTWEIGGGMNFIAIAAYYLSSPFNMLLLFWPGQMSDIVNFFIILKMGLAGFSVTYYLSKKFGKKNAGTVIFGMAYALSAYFAAFSWNIMWLDCMWLLPFIILGLDRLVNQRRCKMYCISLALAIFSNYYIGIMLCIFSVIYFLYLLCVSDLGNKVKETLLVIKDFAIYSLISGGLAACVVLPEYFNLLTTKSAESEFPKVLEEYFSGLYMLFRSLICIPPADLKYPHDPNIYASVGMFIVIPLFLMCKKINIKERVGKAAMAILLLLSFNLNIPNYIWHGLHFPNSLPCRESFIYVFIIVVMGYEAALHIKEFKRKQIIGTFAGAAGLIVLLEELFKNTEMFSDLQITTDLTKIIYFSLAFIMLYVLLIFLYRKKDEYRGFISYLLVLTVFCELTFNMVVTAIPSTSSKAGYYEAVPAYEQLNEYADSVAKAEGVNFYRTENSYHATRNDGARFKYNSISTFSSVSLAAIQDYYDQLGLQTSFNAYSYYGHTPLTASLMSIKFEYGTGEASLTNNMTLLNSASYTTGFGETQGSAILNLYEYQNTLPLGFMINSSTMTNWNNASGNPFETQNSFVKNAVAGGKNIFHNLTNDGAGNITAEYAFEETDNSTDTVDDNAQIDVYFFCTTAAETLTATITDGDSTSSQTFSSTQQNYICHVGNVNKNATIAVAASDGQSLGNFYAYAFDNTAWDYDYQLLNNNPLNVTEFSDTTIEGDISVDVPGIMYTSIPYDEGWSIYVDDVETTITPICNDSLIGVLIASPGQHKITMKYTPKGFVPGILLSLLSLLLLIGLSFQDKIIEFFKKKIKKAPKVNKTLPKSE